MNGQSADSGTPGHWRFTLDRDARGDLVLVAPDGQRYTHVEPVRCFPISCPEQWVSLCDPRGHEITCVEDLGILPQATRQLLEEELERREFVPIVQRIVKVSDDSHQCVWQVETDRGPTRFCTASEDAVRRLDAQRALIVDAAGIRYLIPNRMSLDAASRRILDRYL